MTQTTARRARCAIGVAALSLLPGAATAHAPLARRAVFSGQGTAAAISLPGFGIAIRSGADGNFSYACDALLDIPPSDLPPPMAFTENDALLIATEAGLRSVSADGCPRADFGGDLTRVRVVALAVHPTSPKLVFAVTQASDTELVRSEDAGQTWEVRSAWPETDPVFSLVLGELSTNDVYVGQAAPGNRSTLRVSTDAGATFSAFEDVRSRTLLHVQDPIVGSGPSTFWAVGRSPTSTGNRGFELVTATAPGGPWSSVYQVNFFGGFAIEPSGAIWLGDEGGGVHRSLDHGLTFTDMSPSTAVACLSYAQGSLWGCTPGTPEERALAQWSDAQSRFDDVVALNEVTRMVECSPTVEVDGTCALAWVEWRRDVLMLPAAPSAPSAPAAVPATDSGSSCSIGTRRAASANEWAWLGFWALILGVLRREAALGKGRRILLRPPIVHQT